jgi:hypothetical protein
LYRDIAVLSFSDNCNFGLHDTEEYCSTAICPTFQVFVRVDRAFTLRFVYILDGYAVYFVYILDRYAVYFVYILDGYAVYFVYESLFYSEFHSDVGT